ncbi:MAG: hypothetical protein WCG04_06550 [Alphaproteobacteria bacterium]
MTDDVESNILNRAFVCKYSDDQEEETEVFLPKENWTPKEFMEELTKIQPIHVNLVEMNVSDYILDELLPYAHLIYGLYLSDNFFTDKSLEILQNFSELRFLGMENNSLNHPSLEHLLALTHLQHLDLTYNKIDPSELEAIRTKLEGVRVIF